MRTELEIEAALERLESRWDKLGGCQTCGYHAALDDHGVDDSDIVWALDRHDGQLRLACVATGDHGSWAHPGPVVYIGE